MSSAPRKQRIFISHAGGDRQWAEWVAWVLREEGFYPRLALYDFLIGSSFIEQIERETRDADRVLCLLSPRYLSARWAMEEFELALRNRKYFGVVIDDVHLAGLIGNHTCIDLRWLGPDAFRDNLIRALKCRTQAQRPDLPPPFPGSSSGLWRGPDRDSKFNGRVALLEQVHEELRVVRSSGSGVALTGSEGVGKTALALEYAHRYRSAYQAVIWVRATDSAALAADFASLAERLGTTVPGNEPEQAAKTRAALAEKDNALWIFDGAQSPATVAPYLPVNPSARTIVTTKNESWPAPYASITVGAFSENESTEFLVRRTEDPDSNAARQLARLLSGHPQALEQAGAYVIEKGITLAEYVAVTGAGETTHETSSATTNISAHTLETSMLELERTPGAWPLLCLLSYVATHGLTVSDLEATRGFLPAELRRCATSTTEMARAVAALERYSLASREPAGAAGDRITVHPVVQAGARERLAKPEQARWQTAALRVIRSRFPVDGWDVRVWAECARLEPHARVVIQVPGVTKLDADAAGTLCNRLAVYLAARGQHADVEHLYRRALHQFEQAFGRNDSRVATVLNNLARAIVPLEPGTRSTSRRPNRTREASELLQRGLKIDRRCLGNRHPYIGTYLSNLGLVAWNQGSLPRAEKLFREALKIFCAQRKVPPDTARVLNKLGSLLTATGKVEEAEPLLRRALAMDEDAFGADHPRCAADLVALAELLKKTGRLADAEQSCKRALAIRSSTLGERHPDTLSTKAFRDQIAKTRRPTRGSRQAKKAGDGA